MFKKNKPKHWLFDNTSQEEYERAFITSDNIAFHDSFKANLDFDFTMTDKSYSNISNIIKLLEYTAIELQAKNKKNESEEVDLIKIYSDLFVLVSSLKIPTVDVDKIKYVYKLITYSYLGENWQNGRQYLIENENVIYVETNSNDTWEIRLFKKTFQAFFYLIRKKNWNDLKKVSSLIDDLRDEQKYYEDEYLNSSSNKKGKAFELYGLYHIAKAVDLSAEYLINGSPNIIRETLEYHFEEALRSAYAINNIEMDFIIKLLKLTLIKLINNSIWATLANLGPKMNSFVKSLVESDANPVHELLYPQRRAIHDNGLLDPTNKAVVINLPTSSGKTLLAEFRMLQALNQFHFSNGWIAYIAPTRALVNQITRRLQRDFKALELNIIKMSGAIEVDLFENNIIKDKDKKAKNAFDILVTTPEKLNLLVRSDFSDEVKSNLVLTVMDEAHNIENKTRGINYEILMANIKNDCKNSNFLLLTPFISNSNEVAKWLNPISYQNIDISYSWKPNNRIIGGLYAEGKARNWKVKFKTLHSTHEKSTIDLETYFKNTSKEKTRSGLNKTWLTSFIATQLTNRKGILVMGRTKSSCWKIAKNLYENLDNIKISNEISLIKKYIVEELGEEFPLAKYLDKGIGVHHSGLPSEIKFLMEWLMEKKLINVLVATTTIAQGINFPVSTILMASYSYPMTSFMPHKDFWNLIGRCGRMGQDKLGLVGITLTPHNDRLKHEDSKKLTKYLKENTDKLISQLEQMVENIYQNPNISSNFDDANWSQFLQYLAHMYNQSENLSEFHKNSEIFLRGTLGYNQLDSKGKKVLLKAVKSYGNNLNENKTASTLSDSTGFSPESVRRTIGAIDSLKLTKDQWHKSNLFSRNGDLKDIVGVMLSITEIKRNLKEISTESGDSKSFISNLITDWVNGVELREIAKKHFGDTDENTISNSCKKIYSDLIHSATWGLSSIQKMPTSGIDFDELSDDELINLSNLPAMIYYGVNTNEGILMRKNNIPRNIANQMGKAFVTSNSDVNIYDISSYNIREWLHKLPDSKWSEITKERKMSGSEYKKVWKILNNIST